MPRCAVTGRPRVFLRLDGLVLLAASVWAFADLDQPWWLLLALLLLPDLFMVGYARSAPLGALLYNVAHSYALPGLIGAASLITGSTTGQAVAATWFAHIGMDRAVGYGLKYDEGFRHTHLGTIGGRGTPRKVTPKTEVP